MKFYMVCIWDNYYPDAGIGNIKYVCETFLDAEKWLEDYKIKLRYNSNGTNYEIFASSELPWSKE